MHSTHALLPGMHAKWYLQALEKDNIRTITFDASLLAPRSAMLLQLRLTKAVLLWKRSNVEVREFFAAG